MPTMCIQCSMRAVLHDKPVPMFDETGEQHLRRVHPDPVATQIERVELEKKLADKLRDEKE